MGTAVSVAAPAAAVKGLHIALWVVQVVLALMFGMAGVMKATTPIPELAQQLPWADQVPAALVRFIGISELTAAIGLILPAATRIKPGLTALAGVGLVIIMVLASIFHASRGEYSAIAINTVLGSLAAFVAWGRGKRAPIAPRA
jgi:putative oxidoreductase